jgi:2,3-bisphosphoglycerate-independent phosphoglycerate mutase
MVATYDLQPEMNAPVVTDKLVAAIGEGRYDAIICNYANPDMVGHTGKFEAAVKAIEAIDQCLGRLLEAVRKAGAELLITADHGNAELMQNCDTGQVHTAHTTNLVPLVYVGRPAQMAEHGSLSDIAPSMLYLMNMDIPPEMTGTPLVEVLPAGGDVVEPAENVELHG